MKSARDWLWDRKITLEKAKAILKEREDPQFLTLSALLLSRKNTPPEVFKFYLNPVDFMKYWKQIKRRMRKDEWNNPRIDYWQAIYEALRKNYEKKGINFLEEARPKTAHNEFCASVASKIKLMRKHKGLTQGQLARKLKVSQQMISRIERGRENISIMTLKNIVDALGAQLEVDIS